VSKAGIAVLVLVVAVVVGLMAVYGIVLVSENPTY
jgi:hypothetical protein